MTIFPFGMPLTFLEDMFIILYLVIGVIFDSMILS